LPAGGFSLNRKPGYPAGISQKQKTSFLLFFQQAPTISQRVAGRKMPDQQKPGPGSFSLS